MSDYVVVWRPMDGAAVATYSAQSKKPRVFTDDSSPEAVEAAPVDEEELTSLLASRSTFEARRVSLDLAERLLGWSVSTTSEGSTK